MLKKKWTGLHTGAADWEGGVGQESLPFVLSLGWGWVMRRIRQRVAGSVEEK